MDWSEFREGFLSFLNGIPFLRAILGVIIVFFLPGFAWTLALFKKLKNVERIALSVGLSIALVTLSVLVVNLLFKVRITGTNALITILVVTVIPLVIYLIKRRRSRNGEIGEIEEADQNEE
jgi:uncharacterized membrane protein